MKPNKTTKAPVSTQDLQAVNHILLTWGIFTRLELGEGLNFLPKNALETVSKLGIKIDMNNNQRQWPAITDHADRLIGQLSQYRPKWAEAIKWHYINIGTVREKAEKHGLYKSTYYDRLRKGQHWIAKQLSVN